MAIRDHIPENMAGRFQGVRIIGQVLIPGVIGPGIGAFVLRNAEMIENNDGTFGCVGCGRCLSRCPISMNIVKVMKKLGEKKDD